MLALIMMSLNAKSQEVSDTIRDIGIMYNCDQPLTAYRLYPQNGEYFWVKNAIAHATNFFWHADCNCILGNANADSIIIKYGSNYYCDYNDSLGQPSGMQVFVHPFPRVPDTTVNYGKFITFNRPHFAGVIWKNVAGDTLSLDSVVTVSCGSYTISTYDSVFYEAFDDFNINCFNSPYPLTEGDQAICPNDSVQLQLSGFEDSISYVLYHDDVVLDTLLGSGNFGYHSIAGTYTVKGFSHSGVAVMDSLKITYAPSYHDTINLAICQGDSVLIGGITYGTAGTVTETFTTMFGCDSIIVTHLTVHPSYSLIETSATICQGDSMFLGGIYATLPDVYYDTLHTTFGCDSILLTELIVNPRHHNTINVSICSGQAYFCGGASQNTTGTYYDTLQTTLGCDSIIVTHLSIENIDAAFTTVIDSMTVQCLPNDTSTVMFWDFGNGVTSNTIAPTMLYGQPGYYTICLTASDTISGCQSQQCANVTVGDTSSSCFANFAVIPNKSTTVIFADSSKGTPTAWSWKLGDGTISTEKNPQHIYAPGFYTVKLTIYNSNTGCMAECEKIIEIIGSQDCEADFTYTVTMASSKLSVTNNSLSSSSITSSHWDFGDGHTATTTIATNNYQHDGIYNVCLKITSANGCENTTCKDIQVGNNVCISKFNWVISDTSNSLVQFTDQSIGNINNWNWNFGNGGQSILQNPSYQYSAAGFYTIHEIVKNQPGGCVSHTTDIVAIQQSVMAGRFGYYADSTANKSGSYPVNFQAAFWGDPAMWIWDFGDGGTDSIRQNPDHIYADTGTYLVCLRILEPLTGVDDTYCEAVHVGDLITRIPILENQENKFEIYPNPATDQLTITGKNPAKVFIYDLLGNVLVVTTESNISLSGFAKGVYLLKAESDHGIINKKFIIN